MPRRLAWSALMLAGCAGSTTSSSLEPEIASVQIEGAPEVDTDALTEALANHDPAGIFLIDYARLEPLALEADRRRIEVYFREQGYFAAEVDDAEVIEQAEARVGLVYRVRPGRPSIIRRLSIDGAPVEPGLDPTALTELAALPIGALFRYADYEAAKDRIHDRLFAAGYAQTKVRGEVEVARANAGVAIAIHVDPGPLVLFGPAVFTGSTALPASSLEPRITWTEGQRFDPRELTTTRRRMEELSLTGAVAFEIAGADGAERAPVQITIEDALPNELRLGGGFGFSRLSNHVRGRATYTRKNFFDPLYTFRAEVRPALSYVGISETFAPTIEANAEIIRDDFLLPRLTATVGTAFSAIQYELYQTLGPSAYLTFGLPLYDDRVFVGLRLELDNLGVSDNLIESDRALFGVSDPQRFAFFAPAVSYDSRDDLLSPKRGFLFRLELELGRAFGGGNTSWIKVGPEARGYTSLFTERLIVAAKVRFGLTVSQSGPLPLLRRYFSGGAESQRGFGRRLLSPDAVNTEGVRGPLGGEALLESSAELRLELFRLFGNWLGIVAFIDAGDVTLDVNALDPLHLHIAAGPGLRYHTPIGPIRVDFGIRLNRRVGEEPQRDSNWAFHFSLGEAF